MAAELDDVEWLRARVEAGASTKEIAAETQRSPDTVRDALRRHGLPLARLMTGEALLTLSKDLHYPDVAALYAAVGENHVSAPAVVSKLLVALGGPEGAEEDALDALSFARWAVEQAEVAVLDAIDNRAWADERAAASHTS